MAKVRCPECKAAVEVKGGPGTVIECDECGKKFKLAAPKPAAAAAAPAGAAKKRAAPPPDDDEDDDEPIAKPKKKKKQKKSADVPGWLLPAIGGVAVIGGLLSVLLFVVIPTMKRGLLFDVNSAVTDDVDSVAVVRPKAVSGASGMSAMAEQMKGGGSHYAPLPPEGYGYEPGHVTEATQVKKGVKSFSILHFEWSAKPTTPAVETYRGVPIREDKPKHLEGKVRYVVTGGKDLALFDSLDEAKAGVDRMLDAKKAGFRPEPKWAAYFTRTPGDMQEIFIGHAGGMLNLKDAVIDKPKTVYVELSYKEFDYDVTYTLDYGSPEAAQKALKSIEACYKKADEEIKAWWGKNYEHQGNPFEKVDRMKHMEKPIEGGKMTLRIPFSNVSQGPSMPLIREAFSMGDAPPAILEDMFGGAGKK